MRVGSISYATDQGLAHLLRDFYRAGVVTDPMLVQHRRPNHWEWYPEGTPRLSSRVFDGPQIDQWLDTIDVFLAFETPFDWTLLPRCKERGIKTVLMPMYEWYPENPSYHFDHYICPSMLDYDIFERLYPGRATFIPIPAPQGTWKQRTKALRYLHNAGHVGFREHKGTVQLLQAMQYVKSDLTLTVRCQDERTLCKVLNCVDTDCTSLYNKVDFQFGTIPYDQMFDNYDVYVAPEKLNGLSLPLQESYSAGLLVMASNRYPANTWLPLQPLVPVKEYQRARVAGPYLEFDESIIDPRDIAATMDYWYDRDISEFSYRGKLWAEENSWVNLKAKYLEALAK